MSSNLRFSYITGLTLWAACRNDAGQVLDVAGVSGTFEAWGTAADYDIAGTEDNSIYMFDMDDFTGLAAGRYTIQVFVMAGGTAANTDILAGEIVDVIWDGSDVVYGFNTAGRVDAGKIAGSSDLVSRLEQAVKFIVNKNIQNKTSNVIDIYDDDGTTKLFTLTPSETSSEITITRS